VATLKRFIVSFSFALALIPLFAHAQLETLVQDGTVVGTSSPLNQSIARLRMSGSTCTASFLSSRTLITAAHCLKGQSASGVEVQVRGANGAWYTQRASRLVIHPGYRNQSGTSGVKTRNDFGLINLAAEMSIAVRPLKVADPGSSSSWFRVTVAGFGKNSQSQGVGTLRTGSMHAQAGSLPAFFGDRGLWMVPVSSQATCPGDSGGPVLRDSSSTQLLGVHSLSSGCQGGDSESFSAIPSSVNSWIRSNTK
jgi:trypsin